MKSDIDISRSLKVKCDSVIGLQIYGFLLVFNSNIWRNPAPLQDISFQNLSNLEIDLFNVTEDKYDHTNGLPIHTFTLMFSSNMWPNSAPLQDIKLQNLSDPYFDLSRSPKVKCDGVI